MSPPPHLQHPPPSLVGWEGPRFYSVKAENLTSAYDSPHLTFTHRHILPTGPCKRLGPGGLSTSPLTPSPWPPPSLLVMPRPALPALPSLSQVGSSVQTGAPASALERRKASSPSTWPRRESARGSPRSSAGLRKRPSRRAVCLLTFHWPAVGGRCDPIAGWKETELEHLRLGRTPPAPSGGLPFHLEGARVLPVPQAQHRSAPLLSLPSSLTTSCGPTGLTGHHLTHQDLCTGCPASCQHSWLSHGL